MGGVPITNKQYNMKWYNNKWIYIAVIIVLIISLYLIFKQSSVYYNYQELLKSENIILKKEIDSLTIEYNELKNKKDKVVIIRERISTKDQDEKIAFLENELRKLKIRRDTIITEDTPEGLLEYFKKFR